MGKRTAESKVRTTPEKWEESRTDLNLLLFKRLPYKVVNHPWKGVFKSGSNALSLDFVEGTPAHRGTGFCVPWDIATSGNLF